MPGLRNRDPASLPSDPAFRYLDVTPGLGGGTARQWRVHGFTRVSQAVHYGPRRRTIALTTRRTGILIGGGPEPARDGDGEDTNPGTLPETEAPHGPTRRESVTVARHVVITGAAGALGSVIRSHLEARGGYDLILLDRDPRGDPKILQADLAVWRDDWTSTLRGAHAVLHLAAASRAGLSWAELDRDNVDATLQVFEGAARGRARRVVFASSNHVMEAFYDRGIPITPDLPPAPVSAYGASKAAGERIARVYAERGEPSVVCLRIGAARAEPPSPTAGLALQQRWLGHRDLCQGFERAMEAEGVRFAILNLVSDNKGSPWDLGETRRVLGYEPIEGCEPRRPPAWTGAARRLARAAGRFRH